MKKILLAVCLMFGGASLVVAQDDQTSTQTQTQTTQDQDKQQIAVSELPEAVTAKLESQDFAGWTVGTAYKKMDESNQEMYIVELKQGTETKKVKFDRDGNELEKGEHDKADNNNYRDADQSMESDPSATDQSATDPSATDESTIDQSSSDQSTPESTETEQSTSDQADNTSTDTEQQ